MTNSAAAVQPEPLFRSAHDALRFAFMFSGQQYPMSVMAKMMRGVLGSGKGLVGLDGAAQAGMICHMVKELPVIQQDAIAARYADHHDRRFVESVERLARQSVSYVSGLSHLRIRRALIARYFGVRVILGEVSAECGVHRNTVGAQQRPIRDWLRRLEGNAYDGVTVMMQARGVIE